MTALSLNIASSKSIDFAGIPVESLPPLEAGRTLPQAFADALGKASKSAAEATTEGEGEGAGEGGTVAGEASAEPVVPGAKGEARVGSTVLPDTAETAVNVPGAGSQDTSSNGNVAATGKDLPPARPAIAAAPEGEDTAVAATPPAPKGKTAGTDSASPAVVASDPVIPTASQPKLAKAGAEKSAPIEVESEGAKPVRADTRPIDSKVDSEDDTQEATPPQVVATQVALPATGTIAITAGQVAVANEARGGGTIAGKPAAKAGTALPPTASTVLPGEVGVQTSQVAKEADPRQGDADPRQHAQARSSAARAPAGKPAQESPQTGLSLQLRAAERPVAQAEAHSPAAQGNTLSTTTQGIVASTPLASTSPAPIVATTTAGSLPQFPELAELVDRIAAARHSAGSATATIAVAHKELGNLSLTFEASGNKLDVEVAAQDSETQRSIAAAIAADRPHIRVGEMQTQAPAQTLHSQLASSAQGGGTDARQSGMAGNAQGDRGGDSRQSGRQPDSGQRRPGSEPKSDGGIYA